MGKKDANSKEFLRVDARFADAFNYYMYNGEQVINPQDLIERNVEELLTVYGIDSKGNINDKAQQKWRDLLKQAIIKEANGVCYAILGIENESKIHYAMVIKDMIYDAINYGSQVTKIAKKHRRDKDTESPNEFLSGFTKEDKLTPVITLVIYWGAEKWDAPRSLHEMFSEQDREAFGKFVPNYFINLIVPSEIDDFSKFKTELGNVMEIIKASKDEGKMNEVISNTPRFNKVSNDVITVLNTFTGLKLKANMKGEETDMCKAWEDHKKSGEREARERINQLNEILFREKKFDDLERSFNDEDFQNELLDKYVPKVASN